MKRFVRMGIDVGGTQYADLERMTKTVLELFLENGHKRIAYIGGYKVDMDEFGWPVPTRSR